MIAGAAPDSGGARPVSRVDVAVADDLLTSGLEVTLLELGMAPELGTVDDDDGTDDDCSPDDDCGTVGCGTDVDGSPDDDCSPDVDCGTDDCGVDADIEDKGTVDPKVDVELVGSPMQRTKNVRIYI